MNSREVKHCLKFSSPEYIFLIDWLQDASLVQQMAVLKIFLGGREG